MKAFITRFSLILILGLTALISKAEIVTIDMIEYVFDEETETSPAMVYGYTNGITKADIKSSVTYNGKDYTVTSIGSNAFSNCTSLTSVTIPNSVTEIGYKAFDGCTALTEVAIPNSVTKIDSQAFYGCSALTEVAIPNSVTKIGSQAFRECTSLTEVTIGNSVTEIEMSTFERCTALKEVIIPNSVTKIGESAFLYCESLTSVTIGNSVTSIDYQAFACCSNLTEKVIIPNSVTKIGKSAFAFSGLTSVTIPNSITEINIGAFICGKLTEVYYEAENPIEGDYDIFGVYDKATLYVPKVAIERCKAIDPWKNFKNIAAIKIPAESVVLDKETLELKVGETATLTATVMPENATDKTVTWSSSNESVATVNADGVITAIAVGEAVITATCGEFSAECKVTVNPVAAKSVMLDKEAVELKVGETATLTATVMPDNATDKTVTWAASNSEVVTVNADGVITAVAVGEAVITATCGEATAECKVTVNPVAAESVKLDKEAMELKVGETATLNATVLPDNTTDKTVTWSSSNPEVATVNAGGVITAVAVGEAVITATCGEATAECKVTVNPVVAESVTLDKEAVELKVGETATLTATVLPDNTTDKTVTWKSSDESVATVDAYGVITAVAVGEAVITATCGEATAECKVTVTANSGIDAAEANEPVITLSPMTINVSGVDDDCEVSVYTVAGQLIASERGNCSVAVANRGIYLVKVGTRVEKVSVTR